MKKINPPVFYTAAGLIFALVILSVLFTGPFEKGVTVVNDSINQYFGWFLIMSVTVFLIFSLYLLASKYGKIRLSPDDSKPKYSFISWLAMLFSAGMGIGLMFYGVAEPMLHYANPPVGTGETVAAAQTAMDFSFLHWGLHAWATYIVIGLAIAYFSYRKGYPLSIRYVFYPVFGNRVYGWVGHTIDILAVLGTLFGVATSLGLGAMQINTGLNYLTGLVQSNTVQVIIIGIITAMAMASVISGVDKGIKWLSTLNITLAGILLLFIIVAGPTVFIFKSFFQNIGHFLQDFIGLSLWNQAFTGGDWQSKWSIFYWSWWIAWSPYVGIFIARISKGRTIREFIAGVLFVPTAFSFLWLTAFGSTGIRQHLMGNATILEAVTNNMTTALFEFLQPYPLASLISILATLLIVTFFVTSADSGSFVIDMITSGGHENPPLKLKVFWSTLEGVVAAVLLLGGGLLALQTATISLGLPFAVVLLLLCYSLLKSLKAEKV
ncbi:MAG: BCCT family transporter [Candidatus Woesearchaeota archaeon]